MVKNDDARRWEDSEIQLTYEARYCGHWWPVQRQLDLLNFWLKEQHPELESRTLTSFKGKIKKDKWKQECDEFYKKRLVSGEDSLTYACRKLETWFNAHEGSKDQYVKEHKEFHDKATKKAEQKPPKKMLDGLSADQILSSKRESCMKVPTAPTPPISATTKVVDLTSTSTSAQGTNQVNQAKKSSSKSKKVLSKSASKKGASNKAAVNESTFPIVPEEYLMAHVVTVAWPNADIEVQREIYEIQMSTMAGVPYSVTVDDFREAINEYMRQEKLKMDAVREKALQRPSRIPPVERVKRQAFARQARRAEKTNKASTKEEKSASESSKDLNESSENESLGWPDDTSDDDAPLAVMKIGLKRKAKELKSQEAKESTTIQKKVPSSSSSQASESGQETEATQKASEQ